MAVVTGRPRRDAVRFLEQHQVGWDGNGPERRPLMCPVACCVPAGGECALTVTVFGQIADIFQVLACMEDGPPKPDPHPVQRALEGLGATHGILIGDTVDDMVASTAQGAVTPLGVPPPSHRDDPVRPARTW